MPSYYNMQNNRGDYIVVAMISHTILAIVCPIMSATAYFVIEAKGSKVLQTNIEIISNFSYIIVAL